MGPSSTFAKLVPALLLFLQPHLARSAPEAITVLDLTSLVTANKKLNVQPYAFFSPRGLHWCVKECKRRPGKCLSFNYLKATMTCELNEKSIGIDGVTLVSAPGMLYGDSSAFSSWVDVSLGPCDEVQCPPTARCDTNSTNDAVCFSLECTGALPIVDRASPDVVYNEIGQSTFYKCDAGYVHTILPATTTCTASHEWTTPNINCRDCGPPPSVSYATPAAGGSYTVGSIVTYTCQYNLPVNNGPAQVACNSLGNWNSPSFSCFVGYRSAISGNNGVIFSPGYPGSYSNSQSVTTTVTLLQSAYQTVRVDGTCNLELDSYSGACLDYIIINRDYVYYYCGIGATVTKSFYFYGNTWYVDFYSNALNVYNAGFKLFYSVI